MKPRRSRLTGFTLIELLVVTSILGVVVAAIAATIAGGIRVWDTARHFTDLEAEAIVGLAVLERDVRNGIGFHDIAFEGERDELTMPTKLSGRGPEILRIGTVAYAYDGAARALTRQAWIYPELEPDAPPERVMTGVRSCEFKYLPPADGSYGRSWSTSWQSDTSLPVRVQVDLELEKHGTRMQFDRIISIPLGVEGVARE